MDLCDDFEECHEVDYIQHKNKCIHRGKCPKAHKRPDKFSPLRKLLRKLGKFADKNEGKYEDKESLVNLFIKKQNKKGKYVWYGISYTEIFEALLTKSDSPIPANNTNDYTSSNEVEVVDINSQEIEEEEEIEGIECDYIPEYCAKHNASAYEVFPTDANGFCPKRPNLGYDVCIDQVLTAYCGYCVFIENNYEKRYVATEIEPEMQCKLCCNEDPEVTCRGGKCGPGYWWDNWDDYYNYDEKTTTTKRTTATTGFTPSYDEDDLHDLSEKEMCEIVEEEGRFEFTFESTNKAYAYANCEEKCAEYDACTRWSVRNISNSDESICTFGLDDEMCQDLLAASTTVAPVKASPGPVCKCNFKEN